MNAFVNNRGHSIAQEPIELAMVLSTDHASAMAVRAGALGMTVAQLIRGIVRDYLSIVADHRKG